MMTSEEKCLTACCIVGGVTVVGCAVGTGIAIHQSKKIRNLETRMSVNDKFREGLAATDATAAGINSYANGRMNWAEFMRSEGLAASAPAPAAAPQAETTAAAPQAAAAPAAPQEAPQQPATAAVKIPTSLVECVEQLKATGLYSDDELKAESKAMWDKIIQAEANAKAAAAAATAASAN